MLKNIIAGAVAGAVDAVAVTVNYVISVVAVAVGSYMIVVVVAVVANIIAVTVIIVVFTGDFCPILVVVFTEPPAKASADTPSASPKTNHQNWCS